MTEFEFCLLGPLMVRHGGMAVLVPPGKQRVILAMLLLDAGKIVRIDEFAETLWSAGPPPSGPVAVQNYVMRLRKTLGDAGRDRITTEPHGYMIHVDPSELDVSRFEALLAASRAAVRDGSWDEAATSARAALALWRGEPLADVDSEMLAARAVPRLTELRLQALETRIDADLHLGRHAEVIAELRQLVVAHPLRERLHGLLMLALYRDGRQGEALAAYVDARRMLVEELGTEPGTGLRELHQQMLTAHPAVEPPKPERAADRNQAPMVPREVPAAVRHFTGRARELAALTGLLEQAGQAAPGALVISAIGGTPGVGKTALAVHWAHQAAGRFPDGQLYVNLCGYDPAQPVTAADALAGFLRSLGVAGLDIPVEEAERAARYRSLLAGRRMLVVLDNAGSEEQVRPLLPGTPACAVVVTSRDALAGLVARDGARRLDLDLLPLEDAVSLLRALIGARVDADPAAASVLASQCCRLPIALRVAAELAAARPAVPLAELAGELADRQRRLDLLDAGGDPRSAVRAVFSWSCRHLDTDAARVFRHLALHPGPDLDPYAAAALTGTTLAEAGQLLDQLARAYLIQPVGPGRYGMHDLLRAYARELTALHDGEQERRAVLTRLFDHYLYTAAAAMDTLYPAERHRRPPIAPPATPVPPVTGLVDARGWLDAERATLVAVTVHTAEDGWPSHATRLAATLSRYLDQGGHNPEAIIIHSRARIAAQQADDTAAEAAAVKALGLVAFHQGRWQQATGHLEQALALFQRCSDRDGQARTLDNLGIASYYQGRNRLASNYCQQALALHRKNGDLVGETSVLNNLSLLDLRQGRYQQASRRLLQSLALTRKTGDRLSESVALLILGEVSLRQGEYQQGTGQLQQALALARETGDRNHEASARARLGDACLRLGHHEQAAAHLQQALSLARDTGDRDDEADALNGLGEVLLDTGQPEQARAQHTAALGLATQIGVKYQQARAHHGLARAHQATGDPGQARHHWKQALTLYTDLGAPEADRVRTQLTAYADARRTQ